MGLVIVNFLGVVRWEPFEVFTTQCKIDMTYYPYDKQTCEILFTVWGYYDSDVIVTTNFTGSNSPFFKDDSFSNSIWDIESNATKMITTNEGTFVSFQLNLRRKPIFFFLNIILPIVIVGFISNTVFIIPSTTGEKIGFSVTIFLSFAVYLTIVSDQLPKNSEKTALVDIYIIVEVFLGVLSLVITTIQVRISKRNSGNVGGIYKTFINLVRFKLHHQRSSKIFEMRRLPDEMQLEGDSHNGQDVKEQEDACLYSWTDVSDSMDVIFFWGFLSFNVITTTVIFSVLINH